MANPVERVLREGVVVGLANHTLLIARDGREIPIDGSAAPVRDEAGQLLGAVMVFRDITERRQVEREREARERIAQELAAIVESSDDAIVGKDLNGVITAWNGAAERMYGHAAHEAIGRSIRLIVPEDRWGEEDEILERINRGERLNHFETVRCRKDGGTVAVSLTVSPIRDANGALVGASKTARDISARKEVEEARATLLAREHEARVELERASRMRKESGAHVNPAVTLGFWLVRKLDARAALGYVVAQLVGAALGALPLLAWGSMGRSVAFGATLPGSGYAMSTVMLGEAATTFALVATLCVCLGFRHLRQYTPFAMPWLYAVMVPLEAHISGTSTNPARTFGPALISGRWDGWWIYWVGPTLGTLAAILVFSSIARRIEVAKLYHFENDRRRLFHRMSGT